MKVFLEWLDHFQKFVKSTKEDPVLLIIDNHSTHCTLEAYTFCKANGIIIVTIPPHTSHRLQPLDVSFYSSLKSAYNTECTSYLRSHVGERITTNEIAEIFNKAFGRVATPEKAVKGFEATGIFPVNVHLFTEEDFAPAAAFAPAQASDPNETLRDPNIRVGGSENNSIPEENEIPAVLDETNEESQVNFPKQARISFSDLMPLPMPKIKTVAPKTQQTSRKQHSEIFTSTPMKAVLDEKEAKKQLKKMSRDVKSKGTKRKIFHEEVTEEQTKPKIADTRENIKRSCKKVVVITEDSSSEDGDQSETEVKEDICIICGDVGKHRELWLQCCMCGQWAHEACTDTERGYFVCDFCM